MRCFRAFWPEFMRPRDIKIFAELIHSGQNDIILDHGADSGEQYIVIPMDMSFWQASIFLVFTRTLALHLVLIIMLTIKHYIYTKRLSR